MLTLLVALSLVQTSPPPTIQRDNYGAPHVAASSWEDAFFQAGYAVAQDRLWQMENSRRLARGQMAEVFGPKYSASDKEVLSGAYTDAELHKQFDELSPKARSAMENYARGVNAYIQEAQAQKKLPSAYSDNAFQPRTWTIEDSVAICVRLFQLFGRGGAGELRNMAVLSYLGSQPNAKSRVLDIFDDMAWQNDPSAITTLPPSEDPQQNNPPLKVSFSRATTVGQLNQLPKLGLFELLPALNLASNVESKRVAEIVNVPFKTGSYCVAVSTQRSAINAPLLVSGPQMGFNTPSIIHEMSIDAPGIKAVGMDVPGVPGVVIGMTPKLAWGLTSGVADTEDIFDFMAEGDNGYRYAGEIKTEEVVHQTLKVKGDDDQTVDQTRTIFGPVVLRAKGHLFARRSAYRGVEMKSFDALFGLYGASSASEVDAGMSNATMNFNFFYVMANGDIGWHYLGRIPVRAPGLDPRLPTPAEPKNDWKGYLSPDQLPHIRNPKAGLLANWNNKPAIWWPNFDTPVWGRIFRNEVLLDQVKKSKLTSQDLELAIWNIARLDPDAKYFVPYCQSIHAPTDLPNGAAAASYLKAFDGRLMQGSISATVFLSFFNALRSELFFGTTGNFVSPDLFQTAAQPSFMLRALQRKTLVNYLGKRTVESVVQAAFVSAVSSLNRTKGDDISKWAYSVGGIAVPGQPPIPYSNRGSYIQVIEMLKDPIGRNILTPGVSESGAHSFDQVPLARAWLFKAMKF